ncbi:MAG: hypothetical protein ACREJC_07065, partial [Tepidisphaeraceae bacterium]
MRAVAATLLLWIACPVIAEGSPTERLFEQIAGRWEGTGETRGMPAALTLTWEIVLDGRFLRLSLDNRMTTADGGSWRFQGQSFYRFQDDGSIAGHWFDSRGLSFPLSGTVAGDVMTIMWGTDDTERGRSSYRVSAEALEVTDEVLTLEGEWRVFGRSMLRRVPQFSCAERRRV